ncbi:hypothetical protein R1sor_005051 [Riccia sorocarpa]|uniref:Uncharacterized protein n=1 Tax=Riccia sorocarpa TaxID=122646 RepID=A0ABD3HMR8_9MARC
MEPLDQGPPLLSSEEYTRDGAILNWRKREPTRRLSLLARSSELSSWTKRTRNDSGQDLGMEIEQEDQQRILASSGQKTAGRSPNRSQALAQHASNIRMALFGSPSSPKATQGSQFTDQAAAGSWPTDPDHSLGHSNPLFEAATVNHTQHFPPLAGPGVTTVGKGRSEPPDPKLKATSSDPALGAADKHGGTGTGGNANSGSLNQQPGAVDPGGTSRPSYAAAANARGARSAHHQQGGTDPSRVFQLKDEDRREVAETLNMMPQPEERTDPKKVLIHHLSDEAAAKFNYIRKDLEDTAVVVNTGVTNPMRDTVLKWAHDHFTIKHRVHIRRLKAEVEKVKLSSGKDKEKQGRNNNSSSVSPISEAAKQKDPNVVNNSNPYNILGTEALEDNPMSEDDSANAEAAQGVHQEATSKLSNIDIPVEYEEGMDVSVLQKRGAEIPAAKATRSGSQSKKNKKDGKKN